MSGGVLRARLFAVGAGLSLVDAGFTLACSGTFQEVNPVLRPLLAFPALFLLAKLSFTVLGMGALARVDSRTAAVLLALAVSAYTALDGYWIVHALGRRDGGDEETARCAAGRRILDSAHRCAPPLLPIHAVGLPRRGPRAPPCASWSPCWARSTRGARPRGWRSPVCPVPRSPLQSASAPLRCAG